MEYSISVNEVYNKGNVLGYASVVFGGSFQVNNIAIMMNSRTGEWFVTMPRYATGKKDENGNAVYKDVCNPTTAEFRAKLYEDILIAFHDVAQGMIREKITESAGDLAVQPPRFELKVTPYKPENSNTRAFVRIVLDDCFAINNARLVQTGERMFLAMPSYKKNKANEDGSAAYQEFCRPVNAEFRNLLQSVAVKEYNRQLSEERKADLFVSNHEPAENRPSRKNGYHGRHR